MKGIGIYRLIAFEFLNNVDEPFNINLHIERTAIPHLRM